MKFSEFESQYQAAIAMAYQSALESLPSNSPLQEMLAYQFHTGGKRLRPLAAILAAKTIQPNISENEIMPWAVAVEMIHNGTLIHDDIQDGDEWRRGEPTLWKKYSLAQGINSGDALFFLAQKILYRVEPLLRLRLLQILQDKTLAVIDGQSQEFALKEQAQKDHFHPDMSEYEQMVMGKTSALFSMPILGGALLAGANPKELMELELICRSLGLYFQVQDDWIDLWGNKGRDQAGMDLAEGKISFPVVMAWERLRERVEERERMKEILFAPREQTKPEDIRWLIQLFERLGIKESTQEYLDSLARLCMVEGRMAPIPSLLLERLKERLN